MLFKVKIFHNCVYISALFPVESPKIQLDDERKSILCLLRYYFVSKYFLFFWKHPRCLGKVFFASYTFQKFTKKLNIFLRMKKKECSCLNFRIHAKKGKFWVQLSSKKLIVGMKEYNSKVTIFCQRSIFFMKKTKKN